MTRSTRVLGLGKAKAIFLFSLFIGCHTAVATPLTVGDEDDRNSSSIPEKITDLQGKAIDYDHYKEYVTTGRPWDNSKMYLLYNVGTGKFLNVGSYWGTHATLSDVPRPFWLQRRNEEPVKNVWSYVRYPEKAVAGDFNYELFQINPLQIGSQEGNLRSYATYNHIRIVNIKDGSTAKEIRSNFSPNGKKFIDTESVDFKTQRIEAEININNATFSSSGATNLFSIGKDISTWAKDNDHLDFHLYGYIDSKGKEALRTECMSANYKEATSRTKIDVEKYISSKIVKVIVSDGSITVNGVECLEGVKKTEYVNPLVNFLTLSSLQVGSTQGDTRTNATYNYVRLYKASMYDDEPTHVIAPNIAANGRAFSKSFDGNLSDKTIEADIDLSTCNPNKDAKDENILSIGTAIKNWGTGSGEQNIHLYYNGATLKVNAVNSNHTGGEKPIISYSAALSGTIKVKLNKLGLYINDALIENFDASNEIIAYLLNSATSIQVGSEQGDNRSYATYKSVEVNTSTENVVEPGFNPEGTTFMSTYTGNLQDYEIEADLDLSTCKANNEDILSIGTKINEWGYDNGLTAYNIHFYYQGTQVEIDPVQKSNVYKKYITLDSDKHFHMVLNKKGMFINDIQVYTANNKIISYLLNSASEIQVGSKDEKSTASPNYTTYNSLTYKKKDVGTDNSVVIAANTTCQGTKFGKLYDGNLSTKTITAEIDLSSCTNTVQAGENILSIGNDIAHWGTTDGINGAANIHFYYNKNNSYVTYQMVSKEKNTQSNPKQILVPDKKLTVTWQNGVLTANDTEIADQLNVIETLTTTATEIQVGSQEGSRRSHATYNFLTVVANASEVKAMKCIAKAAEAAAVDDNFTYLFKNEAVNKKEVSQDISGVSFANGDYIEADIDLSACQPYTHTSQGNTTENVFSVGEKIAAWATSDVLGNIHIYYLDKDESNHRLMAVYVNKDHSDDFKRLVTVPIGSTMQLKLSSEGLYINDRNIYPDTNPIPQISYKEGYEGDIVRFKYANADNKIYALDDNDHYIVVDPDEEGYEDAHGINDTYDGYLYTQESRSSKTMPLFITSRFTQEQTSNKNEGVFFSWAPWLQNSHKWGTVGVFADRNLPQNEIPDITTALNCSQWFFEPVEDGNNTYHVYLKMKNTKVPYRKGWNSYDYKEGSGNFYLQATKEEIYGNNLEEYTESHESDYVGAKAINSLPSDDKYAQWRVFDITEYHRLFEGITSEMSSLLDLTYVLRDPSFSRESSELGNWNLSGNLAYQEGESYKIRIGYDQYSKKTLTDTEYTDDEGKKGTDLTKDEYGNEQYRQVVQRTNNHARYMGVDVRNGGYGDFYQTTNQITTAGWYAIRCGGMSTVGAQLFVQTGPDEEHLSNKIRQPLHTLTQAEYDQLNATDNSIVWPYDKIDNTHGMPMYNALVAMNDKNAPNGEENVDKYTTQVAFHVDPTLFEQNGEKWVIRFGIEIPNTATQEAKAAEAADDASTTANVEWTVFDNFHMLYGGESKDPNLVLDENYTDLDYLDNSIHVFKDRPMHLNRTFTANEWNTLVLPVSLTKAQFTEMFGENAKLIKIKKIENTKLIFVNEVAEDNGTYLKANKPYMIWTTKEHGDQPAYTASIYNRHDGGKTYTDYTSPEGHFVATGITLTPNAVDKASQLSYYNFAGDDNYKCIIDGKKYDYVVKSDDDVATDETGTRTATFYGTLCKTYEGKTILTGRPDLSDGKSYYMKANGGNNFYHRTVGKPYGLLGFRCWFVYDESASASKYAFEINGVTDDTTTIDEIKRNDGLEKADRYSNAIYNMNGQKMGELSQLKQLPAGIYIVNGKKYIINK